MIGYSLDFESVNELMSVELGNWYMITHKVEMITEMW